MKIYESIGYLKKKMKLLTFREVKCSGLNSIRRLALFHPDTVTSQLHNILVATLKEVCNYSSMYLLMN